MATTKTFVKAVNIIRKEDGIDVKLYFNDYFDAIVVDESGEYIQGKANYVSLSMSVVMAALKLHNLTYRLHSATKMMSDAMVTSKQMQEETDIEKLAEIQSRNRAAQSIVDQTMLRCLLDCAEVELERTFVKEGDPSPLSGRTAQHDRYDTQIKKLVVDDKLVEQVFKTIATERAATTA